MHYASANRHFRWYSILWLLLVGCASACASPEATTNASWQMDFQLSGGIAGLRQGLVLDSAGQLTVYNKKRGEHSERRLSAAELALWSKRLREAKAGATDDTRGAPMPHGNRCRDCIIQTLTIREGDAKPILVRREGKAMSQPAYAGLMDSLSNLLQRELTGNKE